MADSAAHQRTAYPLAAYNFRVTVGEAAMSFTEVSGLAREFQTLTYRHGLSAWEGESIAKFLVAAAWRATAVARGEPLVDPRLAVYWLGSILGVATFGWLLVAWLEETPPEERRLPAAAETARATPIGGQKVEGRLELAAQRGDLGRLGRGRVTESTLPVLVGLGAESVSVPLPTSSVALA